MAEQQQDYLGEVRAQMIQENTAEIKNIADTLASLAPQERKKNRCPENAFQQVFLPLFLGHENTKYPGIGVGNWVTLAGSPYMEVDVVDPQGNVLFTVPPVMKNNAIEPIKDDGGADLNFVTSQARLYEVNVPAVAENYLFAELTKRSSNMKSPVDMSHAYEAWKKVFAFYKIELPESAGTQKPAEPTPSTDLDYEDIPP